MILVDHEINALAETENGLISGYNQACLTNIGYDLRTEYFVVDQKEQTSATLMPGESVFAASKEAIHLPNDLLGRVAIKNSRLRQGLSLEAPVYQPGHFTKVFFRLRNVSSDEIILSSGEKYATIIFEKLDECPNNPYNGTFQEEVDFKGLADYQDIYRNQTKKIEEKAEDLKNMERSIYSNVLVILTVFVAIFSLMTTNIGLFSRSAEMVDFLICNFTLLGSTSFLVAILQNAIGSKKGGRIGKIAIGAFAAIFLVIALILYQCSR